MLSKLSSLRLMLEEIVHQTKLARLGAHRPHYPIAECDTRRDHIQSALPIGTT